MSQGQRRRTQRTEEGRLGRGLRAGMKETVDNLAGERTSVTDRLASALPAVGSNDLVQTYGPGDFFDGDWWLLDGASSDPLPLPEEGLWIVEATFTGTINFTTPGIGEDSLQAFLSVNGRKLDSWAVWGPRFAWITMHGTTWFGPEAFTEGSLSLQPEVYITKAGTGGVTADPEDLFAVEVRARRIA